MDKMIKKYYANGINWKLVQEEDGWVSIYRYNPDTGKYIPRIQACNFEKAEEYCDKIELVNMPLQKLC